MLSAEWRKMVEREGGELAGANPGELAEDGYPPCPACGCTLAPTDGECSDCGLFLG